MRPLEPVMMTLVIGILGARAEAAGTGGVGRPPQGCAAGGVFFQAMMHLDDFEVKVRSQNLGGLAGEPEKRVDAAGEIGRPDHRDRLDDFLDFVGVGIRVAGGADDQWFIVRDTELGHFHGDGARAEIDDHIRLVDDIGEDVPLVDFAHDLEAG